MALHYLKTRKFIVDVIHLLPVSYVGLGTNTQTGMSCMFLKSIKFLVFFMSHHYKTLIGTEKHTVFKLSFLFYSFSYVVLMCAFVWHIVCGWDPWIPPVYFEIDDPNDVVYESGFQQHVVERYYMIMAMVGFEEAAPITVEQLIVMSICMIIGLILQANLTATVIWLIRARKSRQSRVHHKITEMRSIMRYLQLQGSVFKSISQYLERTEATRQYQEMLNQFLWSKSPSIRRAVIMDTFQKVLYQNAVMNMAYSREDCEYQYMVEHFVRIIRLEFKSPEDQIIIEGEQAEFFYFLQKGECFVTNSIIEKRWFKQPKIILEQNAYFGEIGILLDIKRTANVTALNYCHLGRISRDSFLDIVDQFPELRAEMINRVFNYQEVFVQKVAKLLKRLEIFSSLSQFNIFRLAYKFTAVKYKKEDLIQRPRREIHNLYLVLKGGVVFSFITLTGLRVPMAVADEKYCVNYESIWLDAGKSTSKAYIHCETRRVVLASISREQLNEFMENEAAQEWVFKQNVSRLRKAIAKCEIRPYAIDIQQTEKQSNIHLLKRRISQKERLKEISSRASYKFKNAVMYLIYKQRVEQIAAAFDSTLKRRLFHQRTTNKTFNIDKLLRRMNRKTTRFHKHLSSQFGSALSRISSQMRSGTGIEDIDDDFDSSDEESFDVCALPNTEMQDLFTNLKRQANAIYSIRLDLQNHTESISSICAGLTQNLFFCIERGFHFEHIQDEMMLEELSKSTQQLKSLCTQEDEDELMMPSQNSEVSEEDSFMQLFESRDLLSEMCTTRNRFAKQSKDYSQFGSEALNSEDFEEFIKARKKK